MDNTLSVTVTPLQLLLAVSFQIWMVIFPIIIIRKLNYLTMILQGQDQDDAEKESP